MEPKINNGVGHSRAKRIGILHSRVKSINIQTRQKPSHTRNRARYNGRRGFDSNVKCWHAVGLSLCQLGATISSRPHHEKRDTRTRGYGSREENQTKLKGNTRSGGHAGRDTNRRENKHRRSRGNEANIFITSPRGVVVVSLYVAPVVLPRII